MVFVFAILLGATNTMKISTLKERTHTFNPTATPPMNVQIHDLPEVYVKHVSGQGFMGFCYDCASACFRRNKKMARCTNYKCFCTITELH